LEARRREVAAPARAPWSRWAKPAAVASAKAADAEGKSYAYSKDVGRALLGAASTIAEELLENPVLQADVRALITLVMETAADSLEAYRRYKDELGLIDFIDQDVRTLALVRD